MGMGISPILLYVGSWVAITTGVWELFARAETVATKETKTAVSRWLKNLDLAGSVVNLPATFAAVFDHIFGKKHFTGKCFERSCLFSLVSVSIITLMWGALHPDEFLNFSRDTSFATPMIVAAGGLLMNFIPDYLSLLESRLVIRWMSARPNIIRVFSLLTLDIILSFAIISVWFMILRFFTGSEYLGFQKLKLAIKFVIELIPIMFILSVKQGGIWGDTYPWAIWVYSTFFTSAWVWLYALSGAVVKISQYLGLGIKSLKSVMDIEKKPLRSLGMISTLLITILYLILLFYLKLK